MFTYSVSLRIPNTSAYLFWGGPPTYTIYIFVATAILNHGSLESEWKGQLDPLRLARWTAKAKKARRRKGGCFGAVGELDSICYETIRRCS